MKDKDYRTFILNNSERKYFGLEPIDDSWERIDIKKGYTAYFDHDIIKKVIRYSDRLGLEYSETDHKIQTRNRETVLPRTKRGKEKKLNYTSISAQKPTGCIFQMNLCFDWTMTDTVQHHTSKVNAYNPTNSISLPVRANREMETIADYKAWLKKYLDTCPADYFEKVDRMKNTSHQTISYKTGDIFRFEFDREYYGFALITGQVKKLKKSVNLPENHVLRDIMSVPLLVRYYLFKTKDKNMAISDITSNQLGLGFFMMDNQVIWGDYEIVGYKTLDEDDIDFPIQVGEPLNRGKDFSPRFCWGTAIAEKKSEETPDQVRSNKYLSHGVWGGISLESAEKSIESKDPLQPSLLRPENAADKKIIYGFFGLPEDITFDEFNKQYGGMTKKEYAVMQTPIG